ncbi:MAG: hypothetical protein R2749_13350 [Acidimicrobiales bacterium]
MLSTAAAAIPSSTKRLGTVVTDLTDLTELTAPTSAGRPAPWRRHRRWGLNTLT